MSVKRYLVTCTEGLKFDLWMQTVMQANWIEGRPTPGHEDHETWLVTIGDEDSKGFRYLAGILNEISVQEIHGAGDSETYETVVDGGVLWDHETALEQELTRSKGGA